MIWLTMRQMRVQAAVVLTALLAAAVVLLLTRGAVASAYDRDVETFLDWLNASRKNSALYVVGIALVYVVPPVIGAFWGAPLIAREVESGTHRLVWTQSVSRARWLVTKLAAGVLAAAVASALISLVVTWWCAPIDKAIAAGYGSGLVVPRIKPEMFGARGVAPIGYAVLAFVLGTTVGAFVRRTVTAMAITLAAYVVLLVVLPIWVRPHLVEPVTKTVGITSENLHGLRGSPEHGIEELDVEAASDGAWVRSQDTVTPSGRAPASLPQWVEGCLPPRQDPKNATPAVQACLDRLASEGYRERVVEYQADQYWALQWRETGLVLGGTAVLAGLCFWRVRRLS